MRSDVLVPLALLLSSRRALAAAESCQPTVAKALPAWTPASMTEAWRRALDDLAAATGVAGRPWSCAGGAVELTPEPSGGAVLTVTTAAGERVSRLVPSPDEVVPTGEAVLAAPLRGEPAPPVLVAPAPRPVVPSAVDDAPPEGPRAPRDPRVRLTVAVGPRVSGPGAMGWASGFVDVALPFGLWSMEFWGRYELNLVGPPGNWATFRTSGFSLGAAAGRAIVTRPFELRATLTPSLAVIFMEAGNEQPTSPGGAKPELRLGGGLSALFPIADVFRGVVAIDGEFAPAGIPSGIRNIDTVNNPPELPAVPVYTAGLLFGVEATIR